MWRVGGPVGRSLEGAPHTYCPSCGLVAAQRMERKEGSKWEAATCGFGVSRCLRTGHVRNASKDGKRGHVKFETALNDHMRYQRAVGRWK